MEKEANQLFKLIANHPEPSFCQGSEFYLTIFLVTH